MTSIIVSPLSHIAEMAVRHRATEMISLMAANQHFHRPAVIRAERHLKLGVNDISFAGTGTLIAPQESHVQAIIDFASSWEQSAPLLIHCWFGVSRSPAAALIAALVVDPDLDDAILAGHLRDVSAHATPNARLVDIADGMLARGGRLRAAVKSIGRGAEYKEAGPFILPLEVKNAA